jgi:hypothetical protein
MSFIKTTGEKKLMLFSGRAHPDLAEAVATELGIELTPTTPAPGARSRCSPARSRTRSATAG